MSYSRFIDRIDNKALIKECIGFSIRKHGIPPFRIISFFIIIMLINIILIDKLVLDLILLNNNEQPPLREIIITLIAISLLTTSVAIFSYVMVHKIRNILVQTEFQNMMYSNCMSLESKFVVIVNKRKELLHYDYNFDNIFANDDDDIVTFDLFEDNKGFDSKARKAIDNAIAKGKHGEAVFSLKGAKKPLKVIIEPLTRPEGFSVIRGYDG